MKVVLMLPLVLLAAATAFAYGQGAVALSVTAAAASIPTAEPAVLLMSGTALLGIASAVRRLTV